MRTLVIDCATPALSLALFDGERLVDSYHAVLGRGHAEALVPRTEEVLAGSRADAIAVDVGPGSFTGIRVGLAAARALAFAWSVPLRGFGCLSLCAAMLDAQLPSDEQAIALVMVGGHGEMFWQRFARGSGEGVTPLGPVQSTRTEELAASLGDGKLYGSGAEQVIALRGWGTAVPCLPDARAFPLLPASLLSGTAYALYGRGADAQPMAAGDRKAVA